MLINENSVQLHRDKIGFRMSCLIGVNFSVGFNVTHSRHVISLDIIACFTQGWANNSSSRGIESRKGDFFFFRPNHRELAWFVSQFPSQSDHPTRGHWKIDFEPEREKKSVPTFLFAISVSDWTWKSSYSPFRFVPWTLECGTTPYTQHGSLEKNPSVPSYECGLLILNYTPRVVRTQSAAAVNVGKALEGEKCFES